MHFPSPLSNHHPQQFVSRHKAPTGHTFDNGQYLDGERFQEWARKRGLCDLCGLVKTHEVKRRQWVILPEYAPLTLLNDDESEYIVYKGVCIQPTCYTFQEAQIELGELSTNPQQGQGGDDGGGGGSRGGKRGVGGGGKGNGGIGGRQGGGGDGNEQSEEEMAIEELRKALAHGDFTTFFARFEANMRKRLVVLKGLELMRDSIARMLEGRGQWHAFPNDYWIKTIESVLSNCASDLEIVQSSILSLWVTSALSPAYMIDIIRLRVANGIPPLFRRAHMDQNPGLVETCCGLFELLTRSEGPCEGILARTALGEQTLKSLVEYLQRSNKNITDSGMDGAKELAIRTLCNLSCQKPREGTNAVMLDGRSFMEHIRDAIPNRNGIEVIAETFHKSLGMTNALFVESALGLLWRLAAPADGSRTSNLPISGELIMAIVESMRQFPEATIHEAASGLICNLTFTSDVGTELPSESAVAICEAVLSSLHTFPSESRVQEAGIHALASIVHAEANRNALLDQLHCVVSAVISTMIAHETSVKVQAFGSVVLASISSHGEAYQLTIVESDGVKALCRALRKHVLASGVFPTENDKATVDHLVSGSLCTLASLASRSMATQSMDLWVVVNVLQSTHKSSLPLPTRAQVIKLVLMSSSGSISGVLSGLAADAVLDSRKSEEAESVLAVYGSMISHSMDALDALLLSNHGRGLEHVVNLMEEHSTSAGIQHAACGILAQVYHKIQFLGALGQKTPLRSGRIVVTHTAGEVTAVCSALRNFKAADAEVVTQAASTLINFIVGLKSRPDFEEGFRPEQTAHEEVMTVLGNIVRDLVDIMTIHESNIEVQRTSLRLMRPLLFLLENNELARWTLLLMERTFLTQINFPNDAEIQLNACHAMLIVVQEAESDESIEIFGRPDSVDALLTCMRHHHEKVVEMTANCLSKVMNRVFLVVTEIIRHKDPVGSVIGAMHLHPQAWKLQVHCCTILESLVKLNDNFVKPMIANRGGVLAALDAIDNHGDNPLVLQHAYELLVAISIGISSEMVHQLRARLGERIVMVIQRHVAEDRIQSPALAFCWFLCTRDIYFKRYFTEAQVIPLIVKIMVQNLPNVNLQQAGCSCLWILGSHGENRRIVGENGGLRAVINAGLYHIESPLLQKEALTCLKNLARSTFNKETICRHGGKEMILSSMWLHMESEKVLVSGLDAYNNVAVDVETQTVTIIPDDLLRCVLMLMRKHPDSKDVQYSSCFLLRSLTLEPLNLVTMKKRQAELIQQLTMASSSFPEQCGEYAELIVDQVLSAVYLD